MDTIPSDTELKTALENAKYAALTSRARTEQANALVDYVMGLLPNEPQGRRGAYADTRTQRRCGVEGFLGDLLRAQNSEKAQGWVYRSLRPGSFTGEEVGYRAFTQVKDGLIERGLVEIMLGWQKWTNAFGTALPTEHRKATRFRATEELLRASAVHGVAAPDAGAHFPLGLPAHHLATQSEFYAQRQGQGAWPTNALRSNPADRGVRSPAPRAERVL